MSTNNSKGLPPLNFTGHPKKLLLLTTEALQKYQSEKPSKILSQFCFCMTGKVICINVHGFIESPEQVTRDCSM